jgi:hypothetical protein
MDDLRPKGQAMGCSPLGSTQGWVCEGRLWEVYTPVRDESDRGGGRRNRDEGKEEGKRKIQES